MSSKLKKEFLKNKIWALTDELKLRFPSSGPKRPMKYPYTLPAKIVQFPFKFVWDRCWLIKYWILSAPLCAPIFYFIQTVVRKPENIKKWDEIHMREFYGEDYMEHLDEINKSTYDKVKSNFTSLVARFK